MTKVLTGRAGNGCAASSISSTRWRSRSPCCPCTSRRISPSRIPASRRCIWRKRARNQARVENLDELVTACRQYQRPDELEDMSDLSAFLAHAALESGENQADEYADAVQLMTLHSARLGVPAGAAGRRGRGMFPSQQSTEESGRLEEERRLCYVGMTRAMEKLYICYAESRRIYGREMFQSRAASFARCPPSVWKRSGCAGQSPHPVRPL